MDIYLAAAASALARQAMTTTHQLPSVRDEDAFYARATWNFPTWIFDIPSWVSQMLALVRTGHRKTPEPARLARHA